MALGKIGHPLSAPALLSGLQDTDVQVRQYSAWGLGELGEQVSDRLEGPLVNLLRDPSERVQQAAALALGEIGIDKTDQALVEQLTHLLQTGEVYERRMAAQALRNLEITAARSTLIKSLEDPDPVVRQGAVSALGELGNPNILSNFRQLLQQDLDQGVRGEAAYRLGKLGEAAESTFLRDRAREDSSQFVRLWAAWALEMVRSPGDSE